MHGEGKKRKKKRQNKKRKENRTNLGLPADKREIKDKK